MLKTIKHIAVTVLTIALISNVALAEGKKGTATIKGKVTSGKPLKMALIKMNADPTCNKLNEKKKPPVVDPGKLIYKKQGNAVPDVFVWISKGAEKFDPPAEPVVIDQKDCMYVPHVVGMIAGQQMDIKNSDPLNHNVHSLAKKNPQFNFAQAQPMTKTLTGNDTFTRTEEAIKIKCDVHSWMACYVFVLDHPFFDTTKGHTNSEDKDAWGTYEIKEVPAGKYTVSIWHEELGEMNQKVEVKDGEAMELNFEFSKKAQAPREFKEMTFARKIDVPVTTDASAKKACCSKKADAAAAE